MEARRVRRRFSLRRALALSTLMATPLGALVVVPAPAHAAPPDCAGLAGASIPGGTIVSAQENAAASGLPAHCEIVGRLNQRTGVLGLPYSIGFHPRMPNDWNDRFYFQGGGGTDGTLGIATGNASPDNQPVRLAQGYAIVSTDAGHDNTLDNLPSAGGTVAFGTDPQARLDYGYNAVGTVTPVAKAIVRAYYMYRTANIRAWDRNHRCLVPTLIAPGLSGRTHAHCN